MNAADGMAPAGSLSSTWTAAVTVTTDPAARPRLSAVSRPCLWIPTSEQAHMWDAPHQPWSGVSMGSHSAEDVAF